MPSDPFRLLLAQVDLVRECKTWGIALQLLLAGGLTIGHGFAGIEVLLTQPGWPLIAPDCS